MDETEVEMVEEAIKRKALPKEIKQKSNTLYTKIKMSEEVRIEKPSAELYKGKRKLYHEAIHSAGDDGMKAIEKMNENSYKLVKSCCEKGAKLQPLEVSNKVLEF